MVINSQVVGVPVKGLTRDAFVALKTAIEDAWAVTRRQIGEEDYDGRIIQTAFAQFLVHNVMNCVHRLNTAFPDITVDLVPNERGSAHHVTVNVRGRFVTISSVPNIQARPRHANFRTNYARLQGRLTINKDNELEASPPLEPDEPTLTYIQILHGPKEENRQDLGFILVAFPNRFGEYPEEPISLDKFLDSLQQQGIADEEIVADLPDLEVVN